MITVIGMGRSAGDVTLNAIEAIGRADVVVVKSKLTHAAEVVTKIRSDAIYCDDLYEQTQNFDELNDALAKRLQSFGKQKVAFCVVGDGKDDTAVQLLPKADFVCGVGLQSAVTPCGGSVRTYTAQEFCAEEYVLPVVTAITGIDDKFVASDVQLKLLSAFDADTPIVISAEAGNKTVPLQSLVKQRFGYDTAICIAPKKFTERQVFGYYDAAKVLAVLRGENGCPWDRAQTHESITKNAIEEAYELVDAIEKQDNAHVVEELGDLLMQVLFHLDIGQDNGEFTPDAVYSGLCRKLIDRHPHVFGNVKASNADESLDVWNAQKLKEHKIVGTAQNVSDVPRGMSALLRSQKVQSRASKGGYEFQDVSQVVAKVKEELAEFTAAADADKQMEGGDLLFAVVNLLRLCGVDGETALLLSTEKFCNRVSECERLLEIRGKKLVDLSGEQFDALWDEAKGNVG
ncbi:MAG: nucleoside triphosphate pyrophosphohydrolase [Corallococcus sp.]|nr:nucleoside triphosphate pyrophosphohydrolase [Corallococcus sp.]MCM1359509.1 nucleoside triphosphate pyrophosphohydrolase [Corallococcus sp.]MCM1395101.1 nucleoside triphosphate pyrophosphohydrolase [Corallococcus sp.]